MTFFPWSLPMVVLHPSVRRFAEAEKVIDKADALAGIVMPTAVGASIAGLTLGVTITNHGHLRAALIASSVISAISGLLCLQGLRSEATPVTLLSVATLKARCAQAALHLLAIAVLVGAVVAAALL